MNWVDVSAQQALEQSFAGVQKGAQRRVDFAEKLLKDDPDQDGLNDVLKAAITSRDFICSFSPGDTDISNLRRSANEVKGLINGVMMISKEPSL